MNAPQTGQENSSLFGSNQFYSNLSNQEVTKNTVPKGNPVARGVVLTTDSLEVSLVVTSPITNDSTNPSRPTLSPLLRIRLADNPADESEGIDYYPLVLDGYSKPTPDKVSHNNTLPSDERLFDYIALDYAVTSNAAILSIADRIALPPEEREEIKLDAFRNQNLATEVKSSIIKQGVVITHSLNNYLSSIGPNDPGYDLLSKAGLELKSAIIVLTNSEG